jgi:hypothetical protein
MYFGMSGGKFGRYGFFGNDINISVVVPDGNNKIEFFSTDIEDNNEATQTVYHAYESGAAPTTTLNTTGSLTGWNKTSVDFNLSCADAGSGCAATQYMLDNNGTWFTSNGSNITLNIDKNWRIDYNSVDLLGNTEVTKSTYIAIDSTAPTIGPIYNALTWFNSAFNVIISNIDYLLSGKAWTKVSVNSGTYTDANEIDSNIYQLINTDGNHQLDFWLRDNAGNDYNFTTFGALDSTGPVILSADNNSGIHAIDFNIIYDVNFEHAGFNLAKYYLKLSKM